ncbi:MAG: glucose-6-phosphate dehydrogenase [Candidatus Pacebacteria bacterium]|nr:glucose-6-phosphate dehydrogenase [Candidatus Paceibacterota bacterium]
MKRHNVPTIFAIFGVTGDLAQKKIFPALFDLYKKKLLPEKFQIVGIARRDLSLDEFKDFVRDTIDGEDGFIDHLKYSQGQFDDGTTYQKVKDLTEEIDNEWGQCSNKLFYLSVPPSLYELILNNLSSADLSKVCDDMNGWTRVLIEKPFGKDVDTARKLDELLGKLFKEEQIYRIDHYLGKQTLQNILAFRFSNTIFEPLWNRKYIKSIDINLFEEKTIERRGSFYDENGALRDVGQNHILQMLTLVAMEMPKSMTCSVIRNEREKILSKITKRGETIRGQYKGYLNTEGVARDSKTETFFRTVACIKNSRWKGVPFILTSGKGLSESKVEIIINFKDMTTGSFMPKQHKDQECNKITINIQPKEKISILFWVKVPGFLDKVEPRELSFSFHNEKNEHINAYEKVLFDCISGDQTSFISTKEISSSWKYIMSVMDNMQNKDLINYKVGEDPNNIK